MTVVEAPLTNSAYGYPTGKPRRVAPTRLACLHVTANQATPLPTAIQERNYANRSGSAGPSAHDYVDRDGTRVRAVAPTFAAWSNGAVRAPKLLVPGVRDVLDLDARLVPGTSTTYNANEAYYREIEHCGRYPDLPITLAQIDSTARQIAEDSIATGIAVSRATVHLHSDLDTVQRPDCPVPAAQGEAWVQSVVALAVEIRHQLVEAELEARYQSALVDLHEATGRADALAADLLTRTAERDAALSSLEAAYSDVAALRLRVARMTALGRDVVAAGTGA